MATAKKEKISFRIDEATASSMKETAELKGKSVSQYIVESIERNLQQESAELDCSPEKVIGLINEISRLEKQYPKADFQELKKGVRELWQYTK